jgi:photosystem II stability/assembly factor-like uncharacterized protein
MKAIHPLTSRITARAGSFLEWLRKPRRAALTLAFGASVIATSSAMVAHIKAQAIDPNAPVGWTFMGPAPSLDNDVLSTGYIENTSGRIVGIAAHPTNAGAIYVAAASGGVWETVDGGATWTPLTDDQPLVAADKRTLFMGAIALAPSSPNVIYAGTGEANFGPSKAGNLVTNTGEFRDNIYYGRGVLKSVDAGLSWTLLTGTGEDGSLNNFDRRAISQIVVDPITPATVYAAVGAQSTNGLAGNTGIWRSRDGGLTWRNMTAGISTTAAFTDLVIDPSAPQTLFAAVGGYLIAPDGIITGDPANGIYKTTDAGEHWTLLVDPNLTSGTGAGRIALAIARSNPQILFAAITRPSDNHILGLRRSANGGASWATVVSPGSICPSGGININYLGSAGDYHNTLAIDPTDPNIVYAGGHCLIARSTLGGAWFAVGDGDMAGPHRDHHALAFDAANRLLNGNDGGIWRLFDPLQDDPNTHDPHLLHWTNANGNLGITQFIGLAVHPTDLNRAYGGTQDAGTQRFTGTPQWQRVLRGDGATSIVVARPGLPDRIFQITRLSSTGPFFRRSDDGGDSWTALMTGINTADRANWYLPMTIDPSNSDRLLLATDRVYETVTAGDPNPDPAFGGNGWRAISAPLVGGWDTGDRVDGLAVAGSDPNTIYAVTGGSHDAAQARLFLTSDGGATWERRLGFPVTDHVRAVLVHPTDPATAYVVRDRFGGGHVFRTTDGGLTWTDISGSNLDPSRRLPDLPAYSMAIDMRLTPNILYVGNDNGVYVSTDEGSTWSRFQTGLPNAQVVDLKLNPTTNLLAVATHGRGVWQVPLQ